DRLVELIAFSSGRFLCRLGLLCWIGRRGGSLVPRIADSLKGVGRNSAGRVLGRCACDLSAYRFSRCDDGCIVRWSQFIELRLRPIHFPGGGIVLFFCGWFATADDRNEHQENGDASKHGPNPTS